MSLWESPAYSNPTRAHYNETADQITRKFQYETYHGVGEHLASTGRVPDKNHTAGLVGMGIHELAKIFILRQKNPILTVGHVHHNRIISTGRELCYSEHVMAYGAKRSHHSEVATLVGEEFHGLSLGSPTGGSSNQHRLLMSYGVCCIANGGLNIGFGQAGIRIKQISFGRTFTELSENQLDRNARAPNDGFAHHHFGIHLNARGRHGLSAPL
jgi:hypothetical protein